MISYQTNNEVDEEEGTVEGEVNINNETSEETDNKGEAHYDPGMIQELLRGGFDESYEFERIEEEEIYDDPLNHLIEERVREVIEKYKGENKQPSKIKNVTVYSRPSLGATIAM